MKSLYFIPEITLLTVSNDTWMHAGGVEHLALLLGDLSVAVSTGDQSTYS